MKTFSKIAVCCLLLFVFALSAKAQSDWVGVYEFDEDGGKTAGGTVVFITHQIEVRETGDGLAAFIKSNGFQTSNDLICQAKAEGGKLLISFESYGEDNMLEPYSEGDLLLTLEKKTTKGKTEILTYWNKFQPIVPKNEKTGKVYFTKTQ
jgi:hypothetical protein